MSPDNTSKSNAQQDGAQKPESGQDDAKVSSNDADQVKGGLRFNPQPDPPAAQSVKKVF